MLAVLVGCGAETVTPAPQAGPGTERVVISPLGVSLSVPFGYAVYPRSRGEHDVWVVDMNPGGRQPRVIVLDPSAPEQLTPPTSRDPACPWVGPVEEQLGATNTLRYFTSVGCGGSGGIVGSLAGLWDLSGHRFAISCTAQSEQGGPDPAGCLAQLRTARAVPATDAPVRLGPTGTERNPLIIAPPLAGRQPRGQPDE